MKPRVARTPGCITAGSRPPAGEPALHWAGDEKRARHRGEGLADRARARRGGKPRAAGGPRPGCPASALAAAASGDALPVPRREMLPTQRPLWAGPKVPDARGRCVADLWDDGGLDAGMQE